MSTPNDTTIPDGYKRCSRGSNCSTPGGPILPVESFNRNKRIADGYCIHCRECVKQFKIEAFNRDPEKIRGQARKYHHKYKELRNVKSRDYAATHKDESRERLRKWRRLNPERNLEIAHEYANEHRAAINTRKRQQYHANLAKSRKRGRDYGNSHKEQRYENSRRWRLAHPAEDLAKQHRRLARKRNLPDTLTATQWQSCLNYFDHRCVVCDRPQGLWHKLSADHWIALADPRPDNPGTVAANIVPLCHGVGGCNNSKSNREAHEWLLETVGVKRASVIESRIALYFASLTDV